MMGPMRLIRGAEAARVAFRTRGAATFTEADREAVRAILEAVRLGGDPALRDLTRRFDGVALEGLKVEAGAFEAAAARVDRSLQGAIAEAAERIRSYYRRQPAGGFLSAESGALLGQIVRPISRVGIYVPAGSAPLFSSLLMLAVPAQVAGVRELVVATPPGPDGEVAAEILYTAGQLGLTELFRIGGAQAIAALAYGTETVPRVDKVVGPGNRFVVLAKREVFGDVGIEALPGPTETLVLADDEADPEYVVADLLAQAEHAGAQPVLVTTSPELAAAVRARLPEALGDLPTASFAQESFRERGLIVLVRDLEEGLEVANHYAPEHLCLLTRDPWELLAGVENAGGVFLGDHSLEALGDYIVGPSHVMPTSGTARFASFVNLRDFQKVVPVVGLGPELVARIGPAAARMARAEGLEAHARAIEARLGGERAGS